MLHNPVFADPARNGAEPVYIFDLDGTVVSCNTFPLWVMHMLRAKVPHGNRIRGAVTAGAVGRLLLWRKLGRLRHRVLKQRLQAIWRHATAGDSGDHAMRFAALMERHVRPNMAGLLLQVRSGEIDAVLATAAAGEYGHALGRRLGFAHVLASDEEDNLGEAKLRSVLGFLAERGWSHRPRMVFTDHIDDLPLMLACDAVCWSGTSEEYPAIKARLPGIATMLAHGLDDAGVTSSVGGLCPVRQPG